MRAYSILCLVIVLCVLSACSSGSDSTGTSNPTRPGKASYFVFQQEVLDSNGNVRTDAHRTDSIWQVLTADTTMYGHTHVWIFGSGDMVNSVSHSQLYALSYLANGDIDVLSLGSGIVTITWMRLPFGSHTNASQMIDTTVSDHDGDFRLFDTISTNYSGGNDLTVSNSTLHSIVMRSIERSSGIGLQYPDTAIFDGTRTWYFAPTIGFFSKIEDHQTGHDFDGHSENGGNRVTLVRYDLK